MHHHPALSATLAEQHRDDLRHQAERARLARADSPARRPHWYASYLRWRLVIRTTSI